MNLQRGVVTQSMRNTTVPGCGLGKSGADGVADGVGEAGLSLGVVCLDAEAGLITDVQAEVIGGIILNSGSRRDGEDTGSGFRGGTRVHDVAVDLSRCRHPAQGQDDWLGCGVVRCGGVIAR